MTIGSKAVILYKCSDWSIYIAELCKGSTTDSDSVCLGSNPSSATTSERTLLRSDFSMQKNQSHAPSFLLFRKKARSARLFGCKRPHNAFGSLPTFCEQRLRRKYLNGSDFPKNPYAKVYGFCFLEFFYNALGITDPNRMGLGSVMPAE